MFNVVVNDGTQKFPDDDIYYIVAKEGIFLKKKIGVMESIAPVKTISTLQTIETMAKMHINPIPAQTGAKILEFFKEVNRQFSSEAIVLLFYNEQTGKYRVVPPHQKVTYTSLDYNRGITIEGFTMIGTIHSHGIMSAFHSGVDDKDEKTFDGLHITYGNVMSDECSISASIVSNGHRFMVDPEEYMLGISKTKDINESETVYTKKIYRWVNGSMVLDEKASSIGSFQRNKLDKRYMFKVPITKRQFNPKWMNVVERGTYTYYGNYGGIYGNVLNGWEGGYNIGNRWGSHFNPNLWKQQGGYKPPQNLPALTSSFSSTPQGNIKPVEFPSHTQYDSKNPCLSCANREIKLMDEMEGIEYEDEMYLCEKCGVIISTGETDIKCPVCKTDAHLTLVDENELSDNYIKGNPPSIEGKQTVENSIQTDIEGFLTCLECGNTFYKLQSDECCPFCKTLLPDTVKEEMEWVCPYCDGTFGESELVEDNKCPHCEGLVELTEDLEVEETKDSQEYGCPHCKSMSKITKFGNDVRCPNCGVLWNVTKPIETGPFIQQTEEEHQQILQDAAEKDQTLERIPDPEKETGQSIPLTTTEKILEKMKKVFGGNGNDTTH